MRYSPVWYRSQAIWAACSTDAASTSSCTKAWTVQPIVTWKITSPPGCGPRPDEGRGPSMALGASSFQRGNGRRKGFCDIHYRKNGDGGQIRAFFGLAPG